MSLLAGHECDKENDPLFECDYEPLFTFTSDDYTFNFTSDDFTFDYTFNFTSDDFKFTSNDNWYGEFLKDGSGGSGEPGIAPGSELSRGERRSETLRARCESVSRLPVPCVTPGTRAGPVRFLGTWSAVTCGLQDRIDWDV